MRRIVDLSGMRFGRAVVVKFLRTEPQKKKTLWSCKCDCGVEFEAPSDNLRSGNTRSCGCLQREVAAKLHTTHGEGARGHRSTEWYSWVAMVNRCTNPNNMDYKAYGGVGVTVCERWRSYANFLADMGRKPTPSYSIDRWPDPYGNYEPGNCRWATPLQQRHNRREALQLVQPEADVARGPR